MISVYSFYALFIIAFSMTLLLFFTHKGHEGFSNSGGTWPLPTNTTPTQTVNMPLTSTTSCQNFCGPNSRCAITGQQCMSDLDCSGCQPSGPVPSSASGATVPPNDDAGKLTVGVTPTYSPLTSGFGTHATEIQPGSYVRPAQPNFGTNTWKAMFQQGEALFNQRYAIPDLPPVFPKRYSLTGDFEEDGPFPSNAELPMPTPTPTTK